MNLSEEYIHRSYLCLCIPHSGAKAFFDLPWCERTITLSSPMELMKSTIKKDAKNDIHITSQTMVEFSDLVGRNIRQYCFHYIQERLTYPGHSRIWIAGFPVGLFNLGMGAKTLPCGIEAYPFLDVTDDLGRRIGRNHVVCTASTVRPHIACFVVRWDHKHLYAADVW